MSEAEGVDTIFGYPGGTVINIYDDLFGFKEIRHILPATSRPRVHAADGYARATGKVGVCLATSGPGRPTRSPVSPPPTWTRSRW